jgi:phosphomannomutase
LWTEFGEFHFERRDLHVPIADGEKLVAQMKVNTPARFAGFEVDHVETLDGTKLVFGDDSWILFRQSGTEPLLRVYCEAVSMEKMKAMIDEGERLANS